MHTPIDTIPRAPASFTKVLWPTDPAPAYWPTVPNAAPPPATQRSRDLMAKRRALADEALVRRMVAECAALCPEALS